MFSNLSISSSQLQYLSQFKNDLCISSFQFEYIIFKTWYNTVSWFFFWFFVEKYTLAAANSFAVQDIYKVRTYIISRNWSVHYFLSPKNGAIYIGCRIIFLLLDKFRTWRYIYNFQPFQFWKVNPIIIFCYLLLELSQYKYD
jgi:hypothetical protein